MTSGASDFEPHRFSTDVFRDHERFPVFREVFGRQMMRLEFDALERPFQAEFTLRGLPDLDFVTAAHSRLRLGRTPQLLTDGDDRLALQMSTSGGIASQFGREATIESGDGILISSGDVGQFTCSRASRCLLLGLSRKKLSGMLGDFGAALMRPMPADTPALTLLKRYLTILDITPALTPEIPHLAVTHVYDLAAMALGPTRDAAHIAGGRGLRAARLHAIKTDILARLGQHELSVGAVAARHGITPVYVRKLFGGEDTSFSEFVLEQRLQLARRTLSDLRLTDRTISALAAEAGFGDLSYFNRAFRRRFGCTPSDVRTQARRMHS
jgi:AraC-like DNA-binding protein